MTIFTLGYLIAIHIERMINDYGGWHLGVSTSVMLQCMHLSTFAWDYVDGATDPAKLSSEQKKSALTTLPSFMEFLASTVCPTQSFAGPPCNFADFRDYVYIQGIYKEIPSTVKACMKRFFTGMSLVGLYVALSKLFPIELVSSKEFRTKDFFTRVLFQPYYQA